MGRSVWDQDGPTSSKADGADKTLHAGSVSEKPTLMAASRPGADVTNHGRTGSLWHMAHDNLENGNHATIQRTGQPHHNGLYC